MNKRGQADLEILFSPGFVILFIGAVIATILGWIMGDQMGFERFPIWQLLVIIAVEFVVCYIVVLRMS